MLELAEPVNPCGPLYAMLSSCCEQLGDAAAAMKYLKKLHKLAPDDAQCCIALARNYVMGCGTRLDYELALRCYQKAANLGDSYGVFMVGLMYYEGCGVRRNYKRAVDFFLRALEGGEQKPLHYYELGADKEISDCYLALALIELEHATSPEALERVEGWMKKLEAVAGEDGEEAQRDLELLQLLMETKRQEYNRCRAGKARETSGTGAKGGAFGKSGSPRCCARQDSDFAGGWAKSMVAYGHA